MFAPKGLDFPTNYGHLSLQHEALENVRWATDVGGSYAMCPLITRALAHEKVTRGLLKWEKDASTA